MGYNRDASGSGIQLVTPGLGFDSPQGKDPIRYTGLTTAASCSSTVHIDIDRLPLQKRKAHNIAGVGKMSGAIVAGGGDDDDDDDNTSASHEWSKLQGTKGGKQKRAREEMDGDFIPVR